MLVSSTAILPLLSDFVTGGIASSTGRRRQRVTLARLYSGSNRGLARMLEHLQAPLYHRAESMLRVVNNVSSNESWTSRKLARPNSSIDRDIASSSTRLSSSTWKAPRGRAVSAEGTTGAEA